MAKTTRTQAAVRKAQRAAKALSDNFEKFQQGMLKSGATFVHNQLDYVVDSKGRGVRQPTKDNPVTREEVQYVMKGVRVVDTDDLLFYLGKGVMDYLVQKDYLRKDEKGDFYWVTVKGGRNYDLGDETTLCTGVTCALVK